MAVNSEVPAAGVVGNGVVVNGKVKRGLASIAKVQLFDRKIPDKGLGTASAGKPGGPDLDGRRIRAAAAAGIYQKIAEPPGAGAVCKAQTQEPYLIPAATSKRRKRLIQSSHDRLTALGQAKCHSSLNHGGSQGVRHALSVTASAKPRISLSSIVVGGILMSGLPGTSISPPRPGGHD